MFSKFWNGYEIVPPLNKSYTCLLVGTEVDDLLKDTALLKATCSDYVLVMQRGCKGEVG